MVLKSLLGFSMVQDLSRHKESLAALKAMRGNGAPEELEHDISQAEALVERLSQDRLCYDAQLLKVPCLYSICLFTCSVLLERRLCNVRCVHHLTLGFPPFFPSVHQPFLLFCWFTILTC